MNTEMRDQLLMLKGWLLAIREGLDVGYYNYLNAIDRRINNRHQETDIVALKHLRAELMRHYLTPRSQQESMILEGFVDALTEVLRTTQLQLQTI